MKVTLLAVVIITAVASLADAADPECIYRKLRGLSPHFPNPTDCAKYFRCSNKNAVKSITCPSGKEYNPKTGKCSTAGRGLCKLSLAAPLAEATNDCANEVNGVRVKKPGYCSQFYICYNQMAYSQECDLGSYFDPILQACTPDAQSECWQNQCIDQSDGTLLASSTSCRNFYMCRNKEVTVESCNAGYYFDAQQKECVIDPDNAHCWENFCIDKNDGALPDPDNCSNFYLCYQQRATLQECPEGTYFDKTGPNCQPGPCPGPDTTTTTTTESPSTGCDCADGSVNGQLVANENNCRIYFICENGVLKPEDCLMGNYFDKKYNVCQVDTGKTCADSWTPDCVDGDVTEDAENCNQYYVCQNGIWQSETCPKGQYFSTDCGYCVEDTTNECPQCSESSEDPPVPTTATEATVAAACKATDPIQKGANCYSYFVCISGSWKQESCPAGSYFDVMYGICKLDADNTCPENKLISSGWRSKRSVDQQTDANCTCEGDIAEGSIVAHPTDCDKYLICQNQELIPGTCGQGNVFCSKQGVCVPDTDASCWICANKPNGYQMVDPADCTSYITCTNGLAVTQTCPAGQWFSGQSCVIDVTGQCINPCSCGTGNVPHPICSKYFQCTDGVPQVVDCPASQGFDSSTQKCSAKVACNATLCATAADGTVIPIEGTDTKFYLCKDNTATIRSCPPNTALDPTFLICLAVPSCSCDQSKCTKDDLYSAYPTQDNDNTTFCLCESDGAYVKNCPSGYTFDACESVCTFTGPCDPKVCVDAPEYTPSVNYDDPDSFCLCRAGQQVPVPCPIGYTFNSVLLICVVAPIPDPRCCRNICVGQPNDLTFPAIDTDAGFCLCVDEVPAFNDCPVNKTYDATMGICLEPYEGVNCECNECNPEVCVNNPEYDAFPAENNVGGFCYCKEYCPVFAQCPGDKEFDPVLLLCLSPMGPVVCNEEQCDTLPQFETYPADNGTDGFCYCQGGLPIYRPCPPGKEYSVQDGICLEPVNGETSCYCDSEKCSCLAEYEPFPSTNEEDDTSFCYCKNGTALLDNCPNGKVFDPVEKICLRKDVSDCVCTNGKCASLPDNSNFAALNSTTGFCLCQEGVAIYETCPAGKEYDATLQICLGSSSSSKQLSCDATRCQNLVEHSTFAALNSTNGFCLCQPDGNAIYQTCGDGHMFNEVVGVCVVDACDPLQCRSRVQFEAFAAKNTTKGFCACDIIPTYYHCTAGHVFDVNLSVCVDEVTATVAACDPRECRNRSQYEPFEAKNTIEGFCSCDGNGELVTYHRCQEGKLFDRVLSLCITSEHGIQKRSVEPEEKFACEVNEKRSLPSNCSQYEICVDGSWRRRTCSEERYYNPEQQRCLEPRDDMVCSYARVPGLPQCNPLSESETIPSRNGKNSCMQYFRCNAGRWRLRSCPKRQYYDARVNTCLPMPPYEGDDFCLWVNRTETSTVCRHLAVRPSPSGCSTFLMCTENAWWIQQCPLGMYFSRQHNYCLPNDANQCRLEEGNATCVEGQRRGIASSCRSYDLCVGGKWVNRTCNPLEQFEPQVGCVLNEGSCHGNGLRRSCNPGELRSLPSTDSNCTQIFYYCEADEWHLVSCLRGHSFVRELGKCQSLDKCQALPKDHSSISCLGQPDGQSVPHPDDCTRFYICLQEQPALPQSCASGSFFDAILGYCRPNDGSCQQIESICANKNRTDALVPHSHNCRAYYNCSNSGQNATQLLYCPKGQYFDSAVLQCRLDLGQCKQQIMSDSETSLSLCAGASHGAHLAHKLYCNLYYVCVRGLAISVQCEEKQRFNATLGHCMSELESDVECQHGQLDGNLTNSAVYSCDTLQDGSYVPDYRDCTKYYICAGGVALIQRCALGAYFDAEQLLCLPDDGSCPNVSRDGKGNGSENSIRDSPPNPLLCEGKHGLIIPDTANCNNFYICISNKLRSDRCYRGYFFNATLLQCQPFEVTTEGEKESRSHTDPLASEQDTAEKETQSLEKCSESPTDFASLCNVISEGSSIAEPGDCRRYISCEEDEPTSQRCRNGESYDSLLGICRQNDGTCLMENGERVGVCNGKHGQLARDTHNCRGYFVCVHGQKIEAECEQGFYFNKATNTCQQDVLQQCNSSSNELAKPKIDESS
ncbi:hypothetical protein ACLKA7_015399 [Drosophila subpalustris]